MEDWPFSFRFSIAATWGDPDVVMQVWTGIAILAIAGGVILLGKKLKWNKLRLIGIPLTLMIIGLCVILPPLTVEAYPETYRKVPIPFDAASISNGSKNYAENCVSCHGHQGKGNGILSRTFSTALPDMLTEPHIIEHTPGDFFHWITFGMKETDMPGFVDKLSEEERWNLVNYIHALARGYQARTLSPEIVPSKPRVQPPGFTYTTYDGSNASLQGFREKKTVLLVMFSWPQSEARLEQLKQMNSRLKEQNVSILLVPNNISETAEIARIASNTFLPIVAKGASEIINSYALSRRTISHPDLLGRGAIPEHMEFLIDRYGYLRARWIPSVDDTGWLNVDMLMQQVQQLSQEKKVLSPPENFIR